MVEKEEDLREGGRVGVQEVEEEDGRRAMRVVEWKKMEGDCGPENR